MKKIIHIFLYGIFLGASVLILLEGCYRFYIIDFYKGGLVGLNSEADLTAKDKKTALILGDSFSADSNSYIRELKEKYPKYRFINSAIPGTCARQHALLIKNRVAQFQPDLLIYQLYVGNDLLDWRHPWESNQISWLRKGYWYLSDRFYVLGYLNSALVPIRQYFYQDLTIKVDPKIVHQFAPEKYSARSKLYFRAAPFLVENAVLLKGKRKVDLEELTQEIKNIIASLPKDCKVILLPIPHCMQLGIPYVERMQLIGAKVTQVEALTAVEYPFIKYLRKELANSNVQIFNPLPILKKKEQEQAVYYENDPHLNRVGQQIVGEGLGEEMEHLY